MDTVLLKLFEYKCLTMHKLRSDDPAIATTSVRYVRHLLYCFSMGPSAVDASFWINSGRSTKL